MPAVCQAGGTSLQWGRLQAPREDASVGLSAPQAREYHDAQVVAAAWEEADSSLGEPEMPDVEYVADGRSVIVKRSTVVEAPEPEMAEESSSVPRFAQLPDDPFEADFSEDSEEEMPEPEIEEVQDAVQDELDRRNGADAYDVFDDPTINGPTQEKSLEGESPLEGGPEVDMTPTVEDDDTSLEPADTRLFDELTSEHDGGEGPEESMQYGRGDFDLNLPQPALDELTEEQSRLLDEEREENEKSCQEELEKLRGQTLESIDLSIRVQGNAGEDYPFECSLEGEQLAPREWPQITYMWKSAGLCHKPLYFEQVALERYGHSWGPYTQPIMSGVHFFGTLPILPYKMGLQTPNECVYTLGYYRPGNCAPYLVGGVPFTWRAAGFETGVATGLSFLIP